MRRKLDREIDRGEKRPRIGAGGGLAVGGQVERGAVVDRRAHNGKSQRHVDAVAEACVFEHRQSLVVIHRHDAVELPGLVGHEHRIGGKRTGDVETKVQWVRKR